MTTKTLRDALAAFDLCDTFDKFVVAKDKFAAALAAADANQAGDDEFTDAMHGAWDGIDNSLQRVEMEQIYRAVRAAARPAPVGAVQAPDDPMDWPLPCDVKIGCGTIRKGCKLRTLVLRATGLHRMLMEATPKPTPEQRAAFDALIGAAAPAAPAPHVCPSRSVDCGQDRMLWCATCPAWLAAEHAKPEPVDMGFPISVERGFDSNEKEPS